MKLTHFLSTVFAVTVLSSCVKGSMSQEFTAYCSFEKYDVAQVFGKDSVFFKSDFAEGGLSSIIFYGKRDGDPLKFRGGIMMSLLKDTTYKAGHFTEKSLYSVASDTTGAFDSKGFAIFYDSKSNMPEHTVGFAYAKSEYTSYCSLLRIMVANTNYMVNLIKFGNGNIPAFQQGDVLTLKIKGIRGGTETSSASFTLAKYDGNGLSVVTGWKSMDVSKIGTFDYLDFSLESNRSDFPLYCCIDELAASVSIKS